MRPPSGGRGAGRGSRPGPPGPRPPFPQVPQAHHLVPQAPFRHGAVGVDVGLLGKPWVEGEAQKPRLPPVVDGKLGVGGKPALPKEPDPPGPLRDEHPPVRQESQGPGDLGPPPPPPPVAPAPGRVPGRGAPRESASGPPATPFPDRVPETPFRPSGPGSPSPPGPRPEGRRPPGSGSRGGGG